MSAEPVPQVTMSTEEWLSVLTLSPADSGSAPLFFSSTAPSPVSCSAISLSWASSSSTLEKSLS